MKTLAGVLGIVLLLLVGLGWAYLRYMRGAAEDPAFFAEEIRAFEAADRADPPTPGGIVFVGSSSIRFWDSLAEDMAPLPIIRRGFGGAHLAHVVHHLDQIVLPYRPRMVVVYAGDNDLAEGTGKDVDRVVADYRELVAKIHAAQPEIEIFFLSIKPSRLRWARWPEMARANAFIEGITRSDPRLHFIDVATPLLDAKGVPRDDVLLFDGLHRNDTGYAVWAEVVAPVLHAAGH